MKRLVTLQLLELKRALLALPQILIGAVALSFLIGTIAFCGTKLLYRTDTLSKITIDLVVNDTSGLSSAVLEYVSSMESTDGLLQFRTATLTAAYEHLAQGETTAVMILPDQILTNIMNGTNEPVQVIFPESSDISSILLQELTDAGAKMLSCTQAGIYTVTDLYLEHDLQSYLEESYHAIDQLNLKYVLARNSLFSPINTSVTGQLSAVTYYAASGILLFLLLFGITCCHFLQKESSAFYQKLRCASISAAAYLFIKWITVFVTYLIASLCASLFAYFINRILGGKEIAFDFATLLSFLLVLLCISSFILLIFQIGKTPGSGILLLFTASVLLMFLSGAFIPAAFFPDPVRLLSEYLPTTLAMRQISNLFIAEPSASINGSLVLYMFLFYFFSIIILHKKEVAHP